MDTVSAIRGPMGRPALKPEDRTMFMSKKIDLCKDGEVGPNAPAKFDFKLESTTGNALIDAYIGVDFSIIYKVSVRILSRPGCTLPSDKERKGSAEFYCAVPSSGLDPAHGRQFVSQDFKITPDKISGQVNNTPKFEFFGKIGSINCAFNEPFDGYLICKDSELQIKSIEI